jgi:hypothetical protein
MGFRAVRSFGEGQALPHQITEVTVHSGAVAGVGKVVQVIDGHHTKPAYIGERVDFRGSERIRSVAVAKLGPFMVRAKRQIAMVWGGNATDLYLRVATV